MKPIPSTAEIIAFKMLGHNVNKRWIEWAYDMLREGYDTENLVMLAGELEPYNQFELESLTDKVFAELNLTWENRELVYKNYVCYLVTKALDNEIKATNVLDIIKDIYIENNYEPLLRDFYMLYYAHDDLKYSENQWYWDGATRENIDKMVNDYFMEWKANCKWSW
jgi:hypothetical protein